MERDLLKKIARYYQLGWYESQHLDRLMLAGVLTEEERQEIVAQERQQLK